MSHLILTSCDTLRGQIALPASKSLSARALVINALSGNDVLPENLSDSDDTKALLRGLKTDAQPIDIGAAGTAMRFLTAYLCVTPGEHTITGTERMRHRPIGILVDALRQLGADISYEGEEGFPPLRIVGSKALQGGSLNVPGGVSSQFISALLLIAPTLRLGLRLTLTGDIASRPYLDMTISMMKEFGAQVDWQGQDTIEVKPGIYSRRPYHVESDWSAASYWYEMMALSPDPQAELTLVGLHQDSLQGDSRVGQLFEQLGVATQFTASADGTSMVRLRKNGHLVSRFSHDFTHQPDLAQTFAVTCAMLGIPFHLSGLQSLRIKETDRIAALQKELGKMVSLEARDSELLMTRPQTPAGTNLCFDTYEDHRMAMSLAPASLRLRQPIQINNPEVVSKSYPAFWQDLKHVKFNIICQ